MKTIIKANVVEAMTVPFTISVAATDEGLAYEYLGSVTPLIEADLKRVDARFSPFKDDSLVSRFQRGEDSLLALDREFQQVYGAVSVAKDQTEGLFNPYYGGKYDPTGYVKGWSIQTAFEKHLTPLLEDSRVVGVCLNGGGDMQFASQHDFTWNIGIEDPRDLQSYLAAYQLTNGAVATSGYSKRGHHIQAVKEDDLLQVTVVDDQLSFADVWATAGMAAGQAEFDALIAKYRLSGLYLTQTGQLVVFNRGAINNVNAA